jgi:hypothetical protein
MKISGQDYLIFYNIEKNSVGLDPYIELAVVYQVTELAEFCKNDDRLYALTSSGTFFDARKAGMSSSPDSFCQNEISLHSGAALVHDRIYASPPQTATFLGI